MSAKIYEFPKQKSKSREKASAVVGKLETDIAYLPYNEQVAARMFVVADVVINCLINNELGEDPKAFLTRFVEQAIARAERERASRGI